LDAKKKFNGRNFYFTSIMWMNVEIFCFIVIFYVANSFTTNMKKNLGPYKLLFT
jgi:hypothetical protein